MPNGSDRDGYDIFVSYAHVDDQTMPGVERGWVSAFVDTLKTYLARELGRHEHFRPWMDYELRGNHAVTPEIHRALAASRVLVLFLSKGYLESDWCLEELETFAGRTGGQGGCVFPVYVSPVDSIPTPLKDLLLYRFWSKDQQGRPRTLADPVPDPAREPDYYHQLRDLARDLARTLTALDADATKAARPPSAPDPKAALPASTPPSVFIGGAQDDLDLVRRTASLLCGRGLRCLLPLAACPDFDPLTPAAEIRRDLEESLQDSDAVLFLYRDGPPRQVRQTINEIRKLAARNPGIPRRIALCQPHPQADALGLYDPEVQVIVAPGDCAADCAERMAERLADRLGARP